MTVPDWWEVALLALAAYRTWKLVGDDVITERPRDWLKTKSEYAYDFLTCPWCLGFWIGLAWWAAWEAWDDTLIPAAALSVTALVGIIEWVRPQD